MKLGGKVSGEDMGTAGEEGMKVNLIKAYKKKNPECHSQRTLVKFLTENKSLPNRTKPKI